MNMKQFLQNLGSADYVDVINSSYPELSGRRGIVRVQTNGFCLLLPETHPRFTYSHGSWTYLDSISGHRKMSDETLIVTDEGGYRAEFTAVPR
jgi:hypothetical protein